MFKVFKLFFVVLREIIFDNKEEYNFKSAKFNGRKFIVLLLLSGSIFSNLWLIQRFVHVANRYIEVQAEFDKYKKDFIEPCVAPPDPPSPQPIPKSLAKKPESR